ncbi:hypothetical protein [Nocardia heshunensis]
MALPFAAGVLLNDGQGFNDFVAWAIVWWTALPLSIASVVTLSAKKRPGTLSRSDAMVWTAAFGMVAAAAAVGTGINLLSPTHPRTVGPTATAPAPPITVDDIVAVVRASGTTLPLDAQQVSESVDTTGGGRVFIVEATIRPDEMDSFLRESHVDPPQSQTPANVHRVWPDTTFAPDAAFSESTSMEPSTRYGRTVTFETTSTAVRIHAKIWARP